MYTSHHETEEYPFVATFYHLGVDETKPLNQQKEERIVSFVTVCDVDDKNTGLDNNTITIYFPFDPTSNTLNVDIGEIMEVNTYGVLQSGRVLGVRPSQLGGVKIMCSRI